MMFPEFLSGWKWKDDRRQNRVWWRFGEYEWRKKHSKHRIIKNGRVMRGTKKYADNRQKARGA